MTPHLPNQVKKLSQCLVCGHFVCSPDTSCCDACIDLFSDQPIVVPDSCVLTNSKNAVFVDGSICNIPVQMLMDTGSCVTLLNSKFAQSLALVITPSRMKLSAVNNSPVPVVGESSVPLSIGNLTVTHPVIVADIEPDMLIGIDFLRLNGCTLDFDSEVLVAANCTVPLKSVCKSLATRFIE